MSEKASNIKAQIRERKDSTKEIPARHRRLDTFARLLSAESICVAVAIINGKLLIAANELTRSYKQSTGNEKKSFDSINIIAQYFKKISASSSVPDNKDRQDIFLQICSDHRIKSMVLFRNIAIPKDLCKSIAEKVFENKGELKRDNVVSLCSQFNVDPGMVGSIGAEFGLLYEDFTKTERTLIKKDKNKMTVEQLEAFSKDYEIVAPHLNPGVHAEVQILSNVVEKETFDKTDIYIGISRLCCLHCHSMIESANNVFKERKLSVSENYIQVRGWHDLDFDWTAPGLFYSGYASQEDSLKKRKKHNIAYLIGFDTKMNVAPLLKLPKPQTHMRANISGSDKTDSEGEMEQLKANARKVQLEQFLFFVQHQPDNYTMKDITRKIKIALTLFDIETFGYLDKFAEEKELEKEEMNSTFVILLKEVNQRIDLKITKEDLLAILKDPFLVGERTVKYFKHYDLLELAKVESKENKRETKKTATSDESKKRGMEGNQEQMPQSKKIRTNSDTNTAPLTFSSEGSQATSSKLTNKDEQQNLPTKEKKKKKGIGLGKESDEE